MSVYGKLTLEFFNLKQMEEQAAQTNRCWTYLRFGEGTRGLSGLFGGRLPGLPFPGGGTGFLGGTTGAAGLLGL